MHESRLLVVNTEGNSVELRDATSLKRLAHLPIRAMPHEVAVHHRRRIGYVCISYADGFYNHYQQASHFLEVIALDELRHLESLDLSPHWGPHGIALTPDLRTALITCESNGGELIEFDLDQAEVVGSVPVGASGPHWMAMTPDGAKVFTANKEDPFVTVVDVASMTVTARIDTPHGTEGIAVTPDGSRVYVASQRSPHLYVVDTTEARLETTLDLPEGPGAVTITPDGTRVLVTSFNFDYWSDTPQLHQGTLQTLDTTTHQPAPPLPVGRFPLNVATSTDSTTAYVSNYKDNSITVIDLPTMTVTTTEQVGAGPHGLVYLDGPV
ncbi:YncE family protein [Nocardia colli]|uniref:YncE family protein n=1 Tax=Nocardia colli TaxID=2545717 RepID=UPI0035D99517